MPRQINFKSLPASGTGNAQELHGVILIQSSKLATRILSLNVRIGLQGRPRGCQLPYAMFKGQIRTAGGMDDLFPD
jgi:hypothetical protein